MRDKKFMKRINSKHVQEKHLEEFNKIRGELLEQGYKEKNLNASILKVYLITLVSGILISVICCLLFWEIHKPPINNINWDAELDMGIYIICSLSIVLGIILRGLIQVFTWAIFCEKKWKSVGIAVDLLGFKIYRYCTEVLKFKEYGLGLAIPNIILGVLPYIAGLISGNYFLALFGLIHILVGSGDIYILWLIRKEKNAILVDHPYLAGCVAFEK